MLPHERGECYVSPHTSYGSPNMSFDTSVQSADSHNRSKSSTGTGMLPHERGESYIYEDEAGSTTTIVQPRTRQKIFVVILCLLHVGLGVGCMALQISSMMWKSRAANVSSGVWCGVMFIATGISGVIALVPFSLKVVRIFMILNIVCLVLVPVMWGCVIASMVLDHIHQRYHPDRDFWNVLNGLLLGLGVLEMFISILSLMVVRSIRRTCTT